jgi:DNA mismatch repair protein MutS2
VRARLDDLQRAGEIEESPQPPPSPRSNPAPAASASPFRPSPSMELDLRGQRAEDALDALERYLESAYMAGLPFVRIIHGKGTGKLRTSVRQALQQSSNVKSWEAGKDNEGGEGVTIVHLPTD